MYTQPIHNYHLDGYGHVNNARYLEFLEAARWDFFSKIGQKHALRQAQLVVAHMNIHYRRAVGLDAILHIHTQIIAVQSRQIQLQQRITHDQHDCVRATVTLMPTNAHGRVFRLPEELHRACQQHISHFRQPEA